MVLIACKKALELYEMEMNVLLEETGREGFVVYIGTCTCGREY